MARDQLVSESGADFTEVHFGIAAWQGGEGILSGRAGACAT